MKIQQKLVWGALRVFALFPLTWMHRLGKMIGSLLYSFPNDIRRVTRLNIEHCFPELTLAERERFIRKSIQHTIMSAVEMVAIWMKPPSFTLGQIRRQATMPTLTKECGLLFLAPHIGAWEVFSVFAQQFYPIVSLYRPPKQAVLDSIIRHARERSGMEMAPTSQAGVKALFKALDQRKVVAILPDQDPGDSGGVFVPFFGLEAWTMTLAVRLAKKSGAKVHFAFAIRNGIGQGYETHIIPASEAVYDDDLTAATAAMNRDLEKIVRDYPDQYQWAYKRFKRQPGGQPNFYDTMHK